MARHPGRGAAAFYTSVFPNSRIVDRLHYGPDGHLPEGSVLSVRFEIAMVTSSWSSTAVWNRLSEGGEEGPCGWLKDRYGVSWQIVPTILEDLMRDRDRDTAQRVWQSMMQMKKLDIEALERAASASG